MENKEKPVCKKCNTPLVSANKDLALDGSMPSDGSWSFNNEVCPKCHPELVKAEE